MQKLLPPKLVLILLVAMPALSMVLPWPRVEWPVRLVGLVALVPGIALNVRHAQLFQSIGTNIKTFDDPDTLVRDGAFRWTRNPMYLGFTAMLTGIAVLLGAAVALVGPVLFFVAADRWYIPFEERRLAACFGDDYDDYRAHVRRWFGGTRSTSPVATAERSPDVRI